MEATLVSSKITLEKLTVGSANVIKNITKEVIRDCAKKHDVFVEEPLVSLAVRLLSLNPSNGLQLDKQYNRHDLEEFVLKCVDKLKDVSKPQVRTMQMQVFFMNHRIEQDRIVHIEEQSMLMKTHKLTNEIMTVSGTSADDRERLFKKIAVDVIVNNCLGSPANQQLCMDVTVALKSVTSKEELAQFVKLRRDARLDMLHLLRGIVCGIYIYNKDSGFCGGDIQCIEPLVVGGHATTQSQLNIALEEIIDRISLLNTVSSLHRDKLGALVGKDISDDQRSEIQMLNNVLTMNRQHVIFVHSLLRSLAKTKAEIDSALKAFHSKLLSIREMVQFKTAIPTMQIFPHFTELSQCWQRLQNLVYVLAEINEVNDHLMQLNDAVYDWETTAFDHLKHNQVYRDSHHLAHYNSPDKIVATHPDVKVVDFSSNLKIEFAGFCATTLLQGDGYLYPANKELGVCVYKNKNYMFRSNEAAQYFQQNLETFIFSVVLVARMNPPLIVLLDIFHLMLENRGEFHGAQSTVIVKFTTMNVDCQTDVHPIASHIDKDHVWNVWDYRRKAIQFANLMKARTTSAQTNVGYQRFGVETQTWSPRAEATQTRKDGWSNVPAPRRYTRRTRGGDDKNSKTVKLTPFVEDDVH